MKNLFLTLLLAVSAYSQAWTNLGSGTQSDSVKQQNCNNSGPSYCTNSGGVVFPYADNFYSVIAAWSGGVARTKAGSEQMLLFGGGHVVYFGNQVTSINLFNNTVSALTNPSIPPHTGAAPTTVSNISCVGPNADGTPLSVHSYGQMTYLPVADKMWFWDMAQNTYCGSGPAPTNYVYLFDPDAHTWSIKNTSGPAINTSQLASCAVDTSHGVTADETVICLVVFGGGRAIYRFNNTTNTWSTIYAYGTGTITFPYAAGVAVDPVRKLFIMIGATGDPSGSLQIVKIDISNTSYAETDVTSISTGCSPLNVLYPGLAYDSITTHNIQAWTGLGNTVYEFNPDANSCTPHSPTGGPPSPAHPNSGTFGRFAVFPTLGKFIAVNSTTNNAFAYDPGTPPTITNPASPGAITSGTQLVPYSFTFAASGTTPFTWSITSGSLPTGISLNALTGTIAGTPTASGTFSFTISVSNGYGSPATQADSLTINPVCLITSTTLPSGKFNQPYSQTIPTAGCTSPTFTKTAGTWPTGITMNSSGVISGTPTQTGLFSVTIGVTDANGNPSQAFGLTIAPGPGVFNVLTGPQMIVR